MKKTIVIAALLALSFTTGFTCSKNTSTETVTNPPAQEQMAAPAAPAEGQAPAATPPTGETSPGAEQAPTAATPPPAGGETH